MVALSGGDDGDVDRSRRLFPVAIEGNLVPNDRDHGDDDRGPLH